MFNVFRLKTNVHPADVFLQFDSRWYAETRERNFQQKQNKTKQNKKQAMITLRGMAE